MSFKDLFSTQASEYARFRPRYPDELFDLLAELAPGRRLAWDAGTGSGQAAGALAWRFSTVIASDPSPKQLENAEAHPGVAYFLGDASSTPLADGSVDLVTAAQAFHWFDQPAFFRECKRVLKPQGVVAIWSYALCEITPEVDAVVKELYEGILGPYWDPERKQVEEGYARAEFPFERLPIPPFDLCDSWELGHLVGYLGTWSAFQKYVQKNGGKNPLAPLAARLVAAWGSELTRNVRWPLSIRAGRA